MSRCKQLSALPLAVVASAVIAASVAAPLAAQAGLKIRSCGHYGYIDSIDDAGWTHEIDEISGAGTFNVVSRGVPCRDARRVALRAYPGNSYRGWRCRYLRQAYEYAKVRCGRPSGRLVRYEAGA